MNKKIDKNVEILGLKITGTQRAEVLSKIWLQRKEMLHLATVNPEFIIQAKKSPRFSLVLSKCLTVADGWGVVWGIKLLKGQVVERISGTWLTEQILQHANEHEEKVFLLGGKKGIAEKASKKIGERYPHIRLAWYSGSNAIQIETSDELGMTIVKINSFEPDYLLVAFGSPWQDIWIEDNRPYLRARVAMGVGGVLDEWAGAVKVCPHIIDKLGFKWLFRLVTEPWRFRRQLNLVRYVWLLLYHKLID